LEIEEHNQEWLCHKGKKKPHPGFEVRFSDGVLDRNF
jgi:hypothetical protein